MRDKVRKRIKLIMSEKHIRNKDVASQIGITLVAMSKLLKGQSAVSIERAQQFAKVLGVEMWELFYTRDEMMESLKSVSVGNGVRCPHCGQELVLTVK